MAGTAVEDNLGSVESEEGRRVQRREELLARLNPDGCLWGAEDAVTDGHLSLPSDSGHDLLEIVVLELTGLAPGSEVTHFPIESVIGQAHLRPDEVNVLVRAQDLGVVANIAVPDGGAQGNDHASAGLIGDDVSHHLEAVGEGIALQVMIKTSIAFLQARSASLSGYGGMS